ncbi:TPR-like protein [Ophiobolus disseminans]|uniref:TPR-like protein n=1 Tax=Ophiobolus disseminans TaxID=1469910 RepID=A0A6A7A176_9PLEO|nr:TPR-like protein [Ophiobolus disseminans]
MSSIISFGDANAGVQAGIVNGPVNTTQLKICAAPDSRAALVGLGGVGKSQLAIEHAYRTRERSSEAWVFWVHASNAACFEQSYRDIADRVGIAGRQDLQANIFELVHNWLCNCKQRWLLVLDNVDDARFLSGPANGDGHGRTTNAHVIRKPLREYLPHCERGSILQRDIVSVEPMDEAQALVLFKKKLGAQGDNSNIAKLAAALEYMPLAIVQAAAYILQRAPRHSVAKYLEEFRRSERKRSSLLTHNNGQLRRDWEAKNSIVVTWQISFEYVQQTRPSAADLLSLISFFDRQGIPEALLQRRALHRGAQISQKEPKHDVCETDKEDNASQSSAGDNRFEHDQFEDDIVALRNFCFVSVDTSGTSFEMHALVQLATRMWLEANDKLEYWKEQFISNLCAVFPSGEYENWVACQALYAHAKAAVGQQPKDQSSIAEWATVLYRAAWFAERIGNIADAEMLAIKAMKARKKVLGHEPEDTLWSVVPLHVAMVGLALKLGGQWDDAEKLEVQVMKTRKKKLGADHPDTLTSMANLASTLWNQGRWDAAEELEVQVMETSKKKLGADHPDTLTSMANLALTYRKQGRWDAAEELEVQVMETSEKKLGADHPSTLNSMANLAFTWKAQGQSAEAIALMRQCVQQRQRVLKASYPDLKSCLAALEKWESEEWEAEEGEAE